MQICKTDLDVGSQGAQRCAAPLNKERKMNIEDIIAGEEWTFAKTYAKTNPHEYIVRGRCSSEERFDELCEYIRKNSHYEYFFKKRWPYCTIGSFTYWVMGDVINRRWNDMYKVNPNGVIYKVDNWKELLEDGRVLHR